MWPFAAGGGEGKAVPEGKGHLAVLVIEVLVNTASMTRNGLLKPVKTCATCEGPPQHRRIRQMKRHARLCGSRHG
jgi:hypothetical protein